MATGTRAPSTIVTINLTGQTEFNIPFEYLARKFVVVTLLGIDRKVLILNTDYRFVGKTVISLANPTPAGYTQLELRRETSATERLVDFHDGSILRAYDLNLSQIQTLHVAEEARDLTADTIGVNDEGHLDARNRKIVNLAYAENGNDAIPLGQVMQWDDSALNSANRAQAQADRAEQSAQYSEQYGVISQQAAAQSQTAASHSEVMAEESARSANNSEASAVRSEAAAVRSEAAKGSIVQSEANAAVSATKAEQEADRAKTEADKLANINGFAGTLHDVDTLNNYPTWKASIGVGQDTGLDRCYDVYDGAGVRAAYFGNLASDPENIHLVAENRRLELQSTEGIGLSGAEGLVDISSTIGVKVATPLMETAGNFLALQDSMALGHLLCDGHVVAGNNRYSKVGLYHTGEEVIQHGNWAGKTVVTYGTATVELGGLAGGVQGTYVRAKLRLTNGAGAVADWDFLDDGRLIVGQAEYKPDGNVMSSIYYGGSIHAELNGHKQWRSPDVNRAAGWTGIGNGFLEMAIDGASWGVNFFASDERLKDNIKDTKTTAMGHIKQMRFVDFDWGNEATFHEGHVNCGLIAQEVMKLSTQYVTGVDLTKKDGYYQLHVQNLLTLSMKGLQEQQQQIDKLTATVETMANQLAQLMEAVKSK